jgi:signal transduction histidine kinase
MFKSLPSQPSIAAVPQLMPKTDKNSGNLPLSNVITLEELTEPRSLETFDRMAGFIAHDFRHHLSAIYANAELMCNTNYVQSEREEMFEEIRTAVICMTEVLDSLLLHSKTGCMFHLGLEPLKMIIDKAAQMVRSHPDADKVEFIQGDVPLLEVCVDSTWLCSAIFNLLLDACQAAQLTHELREIRVACHHNRHYVFIRITDSGPGVPTTIQKTLFQPFVSSTHRKGTGLGLTIVKSIVREHGGEVYLEESRPGNTSFVIRLPKPDTGRTDSPMRLARESLDSSAQILPVARLLTVGPCVAT